jgi:hypothetical protein
MTSPDGINWTSRTSASDNTWNSIAYGNGLWVVVSYTGTGDRVMTSPDGINWTSRTSASDNEWKSVSYGNGLWVAVSANGTNNRVMTSPDGINWTSRTSAANDPWYSVAYGNGLWVSVSGNGTVMTSGFSEINDVQNINIMQGGRTINMGLSVPTGNITSSTGTTNMTSGFIYIPGATGPPSGTPTTTSPFPLYYDSSNNRFYIYNSGWRSVALS